MAKSETTGSVDGGDGQIAWSRHGEGPPLLLINGYAATRADWDPAFLAALAENFNVLRPDNRGIGDSDLGPGEMTISRLATDMVKLLDALEIERAGVVGWSMGGFIAQELAATRPERVSALALLATDPGGPGATLADPAATVRLYDRGGTPREQATRLINLLFPADLAKRFDAEFGEIVAAARAALSPVALLAQEEAMSRWHAESDGSRLAAIVAPTFVMAGDEDEVIPPGNSGTLSAAIADARLELFPGAGHAFIAQAPERVAALIGEFVADARAIS
ncbi:MAG TPA: alpha/beta hydrolase [Solirubrobacterales bacterium]